MFFNLNKYTDWPSRLALRLNHQSARTASEVGCILCGWTGKHFWKNTTCPQCRSNERDRFLAFSARYFQLGLVSQPLLHLSPRDPQEVSYVQRCFLPKPYYRLDVKPRRSNDFGKLASEFPFRFHTINVALAWYILDHVYNDYKVIEQVFRILVEGGKFLISIPIAVGNQEDFFENYSISRSRSHYRNNHVNANSYDYPGRFLDVGFTVDTLKVAEVMNAVDLEFWGLSRFQVAWCCTKPVA